MGPTEEWSGTGVGALDGGLDLVNNSFTLDARFREQSLKFDDILLREVEDRVEGKEHTDLRRFSCHDQSEWLLYSPAWTLPVVDT